MNFLQTVLLGLVQGLTEFIPVSSSGHLVLAQHFLGIEAGGDISFEVFMHLGTLLAVFIFFHRQIWDLIISLFSWKSGLDGETHRKNRSIIAYLIIATLATGLFYLIFDDMLKGAYDKPLFVAIMLLITGILIFASDFVKNTSVPASNIGFIKSVLIGLAQGIAIIPGISRSGTTITAALFCGVKRKDAAYFSFMLSIPAILAANISEMGSLMALDMSILHLYITGFVVSFISGYLVIAFLIRLIQSGSLKYFAFYVWLVSAISITLLLIG
ncbi:MAG: undecaprenyl-diphosphate phosphatase [Candidatus Cloacimonetes bacterium]|jgi:undecaprenyl-diphosphatase|nr:undecaprenyl-diphosphate phosphatase [Candidatus Cloacimonadota bacterium]MDD2507102.1 undecaprenyl-diphosphate phosphatase [Candidatus Cloacimonadota bacterium]MDD4560581.1 undecaprenyl-diphosphate phosphatase [Candidatus Cloacimonadota bacterium]